MVKSCETCGDKGFSRYLTYSTGDTVEHMYSSELHPDELLAKMVMCGDEMTKFSGCHPLRIPYLSLPDASAIPMAGPIWSGVFNTFGRLCGSWKGMEVFIPKTSRSEVVNIVRSMQPTLYLDLKKRSQLWPKNFDELGATDCNIGLYIFPQSSSLNDKSEADYDNLVEAMISNDLAMTANMANLELVVFTSLEIAAPEKQQIEGNYYLWGAFKEKVSSEIPSKRVAKSRGTKSKQRITLKKTKKAVSLVKYDRLPSLRPECKRARSKRGKKARKCNDLEADMLCQIFDKPGQAETCTDECAVITSGGQENTSLLNDKIDTLENIVEECIPRVAVTIKEPKTVAVDELEKIVEIKTSGQGLTLLPSLEVKRATPLEKGSCMTSGLDLERKSSSPSISSTVFMELDDEETTISGSQNCAEATVTPSIAPTVVLELDDEETTISGSHNLKEASVTTMPVSNEYHESSSKCGTQMGRYNINSDLVPILTKNLEKHGDIALHSEFVPNMALENICKVVQELESVHLSDLRYHHVNHLRNVLELAEGVGINVKWLWNRCDDLEKLNSHLTQYPTLKSNLAQSEKDIQDKEDMLSSKRIRVENLQDEIKSKEKEFESLKEYTEKLASSVQGFESICGSFHDKFMVDGLL